MSAVYRSRTLMAVAALTVAAAFAVQHHRHRTRLKQVRAVQVTERIAHQRAHEAFVAEVRREQDRLWAGEMAVDEAARVVDDALADSEIEGSGDDDE